MLIEQTLFGAEDKVADAIKLLREHEPPEGYYLCFSGGKDSVVLYDLAKRANVKFDAHHNITTVEPPELLKFIRKHYPEIKNERPPKSMFQLIVHYKIPPLQNARYCCRDLKERYGEGRVKLTGIRSEESSRRAKRHAVEKGNTSFVHPIKEWTTADIWQYIRENNLPYCSLYDEGFPRIGCVLCPFQSPKNNERDLKRFPQFAHYYLQACRKSWEVNQGKFTIARKGVVWTSGDDIFDWWLNKLRRIEIADDCNSVPLFSEDDGSVL